MDPGKSVTPTEGEESHGCVQIQVLVGSQIGVNT